MNDGALEHGADVSMKKGGDGGVLALPAVFGHAGDGPSLAWCRGNAKFTVFAAPSVSRAGGDPVGYRHRTTSDRFEPMVARLTHGNA